MYIPEDALTHADIERMEAEKTSQKSTAPVTPAKTSQPEPPEIDYNEWPEPMEPVYTTAEPTQAKAAPSEKSAGVTPTEASSAQLKQCGDKRKPSLLETVNKISNEKRTKRMKPEFIGGRFQRRHVTTIAGASGVGKTLLMQRIYSDLSNGGTIFDGMAENEPPRKTLMFTGECPEDVLIERESEFRYNPNQKNIRVVDVDSLQELGIEISLDQKDGQQNIESLIHDFKPDLVIFDSLGAFHSQDENKPTEMSRIMKYLRQIAKRYNAAVVLIHHIRKRLSSERDKPLETDDVIGSSILTRYSAGVIGIEFNKTTYKANIISTLKFWYKKPPRIAYNVVNKGAHAEFVITLDPDKNPPQTASTPALAEPMWKTKLTAFLCGRGGRGAKRDEIVKYLGTEKDFTEGALDMHLKRQVKNGELIRGSKKGTYRLPDNLILEGESTGQIEIEENDSREEEK